MREQEPQPSYGPEGTRAEVTPDALREDVAALSLDIGERNLRDEARYRRLGLARDFLVQRLSATGLPVRPQRFEVDGREVENLEVEVPGSTRPDELLVVGAHYDSARGSPGANDNASGVAALLALASVLAAPGGPRPACTLRFVAFTTEEPPYTRTRHMGSAVHAARCRARRERVRGMISLETIGSYFHGHRGPEAPFPWNVLSPWRGDFFTVVGNPASHALVRRCVKAFPREPEVRCLGVTLPGFLPLVKSSDHWAFWKQGYPAVMVSDTAPLRYRHYHRGSDTFDRVDYETLARVVSGLARMVEGLTTGPIP
jgi:hypothetical protein